MRHSLGVFDLGLGVIRGMRLVLRGLIGTDLESLCFFPRLDYWLLNFKGKKQ